MLLKSFYRKLANLTEKNNVVWRISRENKIRCTLNGRVCCPITAVLNLELGKRINVGDAVDYSDDIGLSYDDAKTITIAADFSQKEMNGDYRYGELSRNKKKDVSSREAIIRATNLAQ